MDRPTRLFISYAHKDEEHKDDLVTHLASLRRAGLVDAWTDRAIKPGEAWEPAILGQLNTADMVLLLVSPDFLASDFCFDVEVTRALERHERNETTVIPVIVRPCDWQTTPFAEIQGVPRDAKPITMWDDRDTAWLDVVTRLRGLIAAPKPGGSADSPKYSKSLDVSLISTSGLPASGTPELIGRDTEIVRLDEAWIDPSIRAIVFVAIGGAGKTTLVDHWLRWMEAERWRGAEAVYVWSFYSQGTGEDRQATGDAFVDSALRFFGDADSSAGSPRERGLRLARLVRARRTLLVLDGLEPIQEPPTSGRAGRIKDPAVAALVRELASTQSGLLVITTREPVTDLVSFARSAPSHDLERLNDAAGAHLLCRLGVQGSDSELEEVVRELRGHCLALTLLGTYLRDAHGGDVRAWRDVPLLDASDAMGDDKAFRVMAQYAEWFDGPEQQILLFLGLFDRPTDAEAVAAFRTEPAIPDLTDQWVGLAAPRWNIALGRLRTARLLLDDDFGPLGSLDAHPLVREHFGRALEQGSPASFRAGHARLYEHYTASAPRRPNTLEAMQPLYRAVHHGCLAGRRVEVFEGVFQSRIRRWKTYFTTNKLGAYGSELSAIAGFFEQAWIRPDKAFRGYYRAWLLNEAAICLRALGRSNEAWTPLELCHRRVLEAENWKQAATSASNLSELSLTLGRIDDALTYGSASVDLATLSGDAFQRMGNRTTWGDALHAAGKFDEAKSKIDKAEQMQATYQPELPKLYSLQGYRLSDLILGQAAPLDGSYLSVESVRKQGVVSPDHRRRCEEVYRRGRQLIRWREPGDTMLDIALDHLTIGRASLGLALIDGHGWEQVSSVLNQAVERFRLANKDDHLPRGLIARAMLFRSTDEVSAAEVDLGEALELAERGSMRLHECDAHLEWGRLRWSVGDRDGARSHLERAATLVDETGYHRRDREVAELRAALDS